jgi:hypothetical protein
MAPPEPPPLTPEMERFLSQPFTAAELDEARRTSVLAGSRPKQTAGNGGAARK